MISPPGAPSKDKPKTVYVFMKHNDCAVIQLCDKDGNVIEEKDGYLPPVGIFGGCSTELKIDNETGYILNWKSINTLKGEDDD